ncbi:hypothetical protein FPQ18DRAFT_85076 [Pyronema domesticum]|nr:hypothetical protein FPQ18DRAFT_85076 [Pyronema domesticum]
MRRFLLRTILLVRISRRLLWMPVRVLLSQPADTKTRPSQPAPVPSEGMDRVHRNRETPLAGENSPYSRGAESNRLAGDELSRIFLWCY